MQNKTPKAHSFINSEAVLLMSPYRTESGCLFIYLFLIPKFGRVCNKFASTYYLFSTSSWLFYPTRARFAGPLQEASIVSAHWRTEYDSLSRILCSAAIERISLSYLRRLEMCCSDLYPGNSYFFNLHGFPYCEGL